MEDIFQHFRPDEKDLILELYSKLEDSSTNSYPVLLRFLDPREQMILKNLKGNFAGITVSFFGGGKNEGRERMRAIIHPEFIPVSIEDFEIVVFRMEYPSKFIDLSHRNILGALMSLGFDRDKLGDIVVSKTIEFAVDKTMSQYIEMEFTKVKNAPIKLIELNPSLMQENKEKTREMVIIVSSYRLDAIVSEVLKEGRQKSKTRIEKEKVKVNHGVIIEPAFRVDEGDIISVRGFGRFIVKEWIQETRKGKHRFRVDVFID